MMKAAEVVAGKNNIATAYKKSQKKGHVRTALKPFQSLLPSSEPVRQPAEVAVSPIRAPQQDALLIAGEVPLALTMPGTVPNPAKEAEPEGFPVLTLRSKPSTTWLASPADQLVMKDEMQSQEPTSPPSDQATPNPLLGQAEEPEEVRTLLPFLQPERGQEGEEKGGNANPLFLGEQNENINENIEVREPQGAGEGEKGKGAEPSTPSLLPPPLLPSSYSLSPAETGSEAFLLPLLEQVREHLERLVRLQDQEGVRLYLQPPELGALDILVQVQGTEVHAQVAAEQEWTRRMLEHSIEQLRALLAERGLQLNEFQVNLGIFSQGYSFAGGHHHSPEALDQVTPRIEPIQRGRATILTPRTAEINPLGRWSIWV